MLAQRVSLPPPERLPVSIRLHVSVDVSRAYGPEDTVADLGAAGCKEIF
jgi:hypothetical protein